MNTPREVAVLNAAGKLYNLEDNLFDIDYLAHALARVPRFRGTTRVPFSVLDHLMNGLKLCESETERKAWLLHEMWEGYTEMDVPSPMKLTWEWYRRREDEYLDYVYDLHELVYQEQKFAVKEVDIAMLVTEGVRLFPDNIEYDWKKLGDPVDITLERYSVEEFLTEYRELFKEVKGLEINNFERKSPSFREGM